MLRRFKVKLAIAVLLTWLVASGFALYYFFLSDFGVFDEQLLWQEKPLQAELTQAQLSDIIDKNATWQAVLVVSDTCRCSAFAVSHLTRLKRKIPELVVTELSLTKAKALGIHVIATPLLMLLDKQKLIYAGPLAEDRFCSDNAGLIETVLKGEVALPGFWLNGESSACRCAL